MTNLKNVIILTTGLSGSSVLTGLVSRGGYWLGEDTAKKRNYDTYENSRLVELNTQILKKFDFHAKYVDVFSSEIIKKIEKLYDENDIDKIHYKNFLKELDDHEPWILKDPRLWVTIRFWKKFMDFKNCAFILLTRDNLQSWISTNLNHHIQSYKYCKNYLESINNSIINFFEENKLKYHVAKFDDLIMKPEKTIASLNNYLGTQLTIEDLKKIYTKPLYRKHRNFFHFLKAIAIFMKNYTERQG